MRRLGYQALGFVVWTAAKRYLRRRFGDAQRKLAIAALLAFALAALLLGRRRAEGA